MTFLLWIYFKENYLDKTKRFFSGLKSETLGSDKGDRKNTA